MPKQTYSKYFLPLNDLQLQDKIYFPNNWEFDGKQYAYTQGVIAEGLVYNKRVFKSAGIEKLPTTLDELMTNAAKLKSAGKVAIALNLGAAWPLQQWDKSAMALASDGNYFARMITDDAPFSSGKPYYQSLKIAHTLFASEYSEADFILNNWEQSKRDFIANKNAMFFLGNWVIPQLIESGMRSDDIGFIPFPFDNSGKPKAILNFDWGMAVSRYSKNPDTAKAWIRFMITKSDFADVAGFIPTDKSRNTAMPQLAEYMDYKPEIIQAAPESNDFIRMANKAGMDFMSGNYIRNILISPDFDGSMAYWNKRWRQAKENFQATTFGE
ncbi:ABC-type glycerol-3-phosphate transport system substrate-binding protein [Cellvibrio fibrivorans]|uniref:ABC-type glycerol-3-phosphate transport system substrate-binding protein n=2 Tax=Cellvibrio fibrivorans TaxID=126350 RepID=A0ABU1V3X1_9GAMM|nr:ABC-type glycerol-3-phosphate transport system substrate-binding protein [Cellvibrio fibrivorans]